MKWAQVLWHTYQFHKDWFKHSKFDRGDTHTDIQTNKQTNKQRNTHTQQGDLISLLLSFQNKETRLKTRGLRDRRPVCLCIPLNFEKKKRLMRSPCCLCIAPPKFFVFYAVRGISKESRRLFRPSIFCNIIPPICVSQAKSALLVSRLKFCIHF
jgi:hypothetical protein